MKRLGIFAFFDKDGIVGDYITILLNDLASCLDSLVIVVNGCVSKEGIKEFQKFTKNILLRDNAGYDAGAYKDAIFNYIGVETVRSYNQVILFNDTFYGPFIPFKEIFAEMDKEDTDFWGINYVRNNVADHIQSYFLVINNSIIKKGDLFEYFERWIDDKGVEIQDVYAWFEVGIFDFLVNKGYRFSSFIKENNCDIYKSSNYVIKKNNFPVMKKKSFAPPYYIEENVMDALKYIDGNLNYDIGLILQDAKRVYGFKYDKNTIVNYPDMPSYEYKYPVAKNGRKEIEAFLKENQDIYIYGTGIIARKLYRLHYSYFHNVEGFVVSDDQDIKCQRMYGYKVLHLSEIEMTAASVIVALNAEHSRMVEAGLGKCKNVLFLW